MNSNLLFSYGNQKAHPAINTAIVEKFIKSYLNYPEFKNYTIALVSVDLEGIDVTAGGNIAITSSVVAHSPKEWIIRGGYTADEPELPAALRHFYDPKANYEKKKYLTDLNDKGGVNPKMDAITWHFDAGDNAWTWDAGKKAMIYALTEANPETRNNHLAQAFRCLGEVLHNTADMFCPPHVRNDAHGGWPGVGGADPYESLFKPAWVDDYEDEKPDPQLASFLSSADISFEINNKAAEFTNKYFFSDETISGTGVEQYSSRNKFPDYDAPKLEKLKYDNVSFNYSYTFPSGRIVDMCNDKSLFLGYETGLFRSYPRVNEACVKSQASELIPNIIAAGAKVIKNFIPIFEITAEANLKEKKLKGEVKHVSTPEYLSPIAYNGEVAFFVNNKMSKIKAIATDGKFEVFSDEFKANDKIQAYIYFADITVKSNEIKVEDNAQYTIINFEHPKGIVINSPSTITPLVNDSKKWSGESTTLTMNFSGSVNAPPDTELQPYWYKDPQSEYDVTFYCKNDKEIDVNLIIKYDITPDKWTWTGIGVVNMKKDTIIAPLSFDGFEIKLEDNRPDEGFELPSITTLDYNKELKEINISFKFDPKIHFEGEPITNGLHVILSPIISGTNSKYNVTWSEGIDSTGKLVGTKDSKYFLSINFWQHYKE
jgi:hypothetical protein